MGQKVNPYGLRLGIINDWRTRWYSEKEFAAYLYEDIQIRRHVHGKLEHAGLARIDIERTEQQVKVVIHAGRPGIVIGKKGAEVDKLRNHLEKLTGKRVRVDIQEVRRPEISAPLIAQNVAAQLEGRVSFRRAMKKAVSQAMAGGVKGIRISSAGRLGGAEMSRTEWYREGRVPLHTLKADIEYGTAEADTKSGKIGVKVWLYHGDVELHGTSIRHEFQEELTEEFMPRPRPKPAPKAETGAKAETAPKEETGKKLETATKKETGVKAETAPKKETAKKTDTGVKTEPASKEEPAKPAVKKEAPKKEAAAKKPAAKKEATPKKPVAKAQTAPKRETGKKAETSSRKESGAKAETKPKKETAKKKTAAKKPAEIASSPKKTAPRKDAKSKEAK